MYPKHRSKGKDTKHGGPAKTVALRCDVTGIVTPLTDLVRSTRTHLDRYGNVISKQGTFVMAVF